MPFSADSVRSQLAAVLSEKFDLAEPLGAGAFAVVFRAYDRFLERDVAVKVLDPGLAPTPAQQEQFLREARIIASVEHPYIVPLYSAESRSGLQYLVMRLLSGRTLATRMKSERCLSPAEAARLAHEIAQALEAAHERGVVHRDIKPENILLDGIGHAAVTDFGVSQLTARAVDQLGISVGTPGYMSPEQILGEAVDGKADIYSLGVVLFEMLAGRPPFEAETPSGLLRQHVTDAPPDLLQLRPDTPALLADITRRALAKERDLRPSAAELTAELEVARHPDALLSPRAARWRRIRRRLPVAGVTILAAIVIWKVWSFWEGGMARLSSVLLVGAEPKLIAEGAKIPKPLIDSLRAEGTIQPGEVPYYVFSPSSAHDGQMLILVDSAMIWRDGEHTRRWRAGRGFSLEFEFGSANSQQAGGNLFVSSNRGSVPPDTLAKGLSGVDVAQLSRSMNAAMCLQRPERCVRYGAEAQ